MTDPLRLFIVAGEASGDRLAADLVQGLKARMPVEVSGVGGEELAEQGLRPLFPMEDLAVMGLVDVLGRLPLLLWRVRQTARAIAEQKPDIAVLVDSQEFSRMVAKRLRSMGYTGKLILYVAPSVWARSPGRAARLAPLFDEVLAVLPFEPKVMRQLGGPHTSYVGHPSLKEVSGFTRSPAPQRIALLPGSRAGELRRHLPMFRAAVAEIAAYDPSMQFYIPTLARTRETVAAATADWPVSVERVSDRSQRAQLYAETRMALCAAGTATLEVALAGVPMVIVYVMDRPQAVVYRRLGRPTVGLPNILLGRNAAPELVLARPDARRVAKEAAALASDATALSAQAEAFKTLRQLMEDGVEGAERQDPAERVLAHVNR
ncbi:lipid-A-disaccharide synthase [Devosia pacifica]|uniref:Lipid-A-disaccharide synthase n=1 Tax=Devosia pacifica TaxID=1335967 RepID=A0A918RRX7_9HYPH|nr:lipid-A-disaccharide synthase [Devosia pacifica]GHA10716.1 lipid-A-disaccharide synthase [Devosia pacifica]